MAASARLTPAQVFALTRALRSISDRSLRRSLVELFRHVYLRADQFDVIVLTARRLSCLYAAMIEGGIAELEGVVVSDRILETVTPKAWIGKRVLIVDDSIIVGATLAYLVRDIRRLVTAKGRVTVWTACVDSEQISPGLKKYIRARAFCEAPSSTVRRFSGDVAKVLFQSTMPYFTDFIISRRVNLDLQQLVRIFNTPDWYVADVTSPLVASEDDSTYTFIPRPSLLSKLTAQLRKRSPLAAESLIMTKVRFFVKVEGLDVSLRLVPIALTREISLAEADEMLQQLCPALGVPQVLAEVPDWTLAAKHRYLQLLCSLFVLEDAWKLVSPPGSKQPQDRERIAFNLMKINFGELVATSLSAALEAVGIQSAAVKGGTRFRTPPGSAEPKFEPIRSELAHAQSAMKLAIAARVRAAQRFSTHFKPPTKPVAGQLIFFGQVDVAPIAELFWYVDKLGFRNRPPDLQELTARQFFKRFPDMQIWRQHQGLTMSELTKAYQWASTDPEWARNVCALAVDVCNDTGVAVPANQTSHGGNSSARTFRTGESSHLGSASGVSNRFFSEDTSVTPLYLLSRIYTKTTSIGDGFTLDFQVEERARARYKRIVAESFPSIESDGGLTITAE